MHARVALVLVDADLYGDTTFLGKLKGVTNQVE